MGGHRWNRRSALNLTFICLVRVKRHSGPDLQNRCPSSSALPRPQRRSSGRFVPSASPCADAEWSGVLVSLTGLGGFWHPNEVVCGGGAEADILASRETWLPAALASSIPAAPPAPPRSQHAARARLTSLKQRQSRKTNSDEIDNEVEAVVGTSQGVDVILCQGNLKVLPPAENLPSTQMLYCCRARLHGGGVRHLRFMPQRGGI